MPKREPLSSTNDVESQGVSSGIPKPATDQLAVETACQLIDSYVLAVLQEPPPSPVSHRDAASTVSIDPAASTMA
jgi:hypothetical protein